MAPGDFKFRVCMVLMKISMILARFWSITGSKLAKTGSKKIKKFYSRSCSYLAVLRLFSPDHMHWIGLVSCVSAQRRHRKSTAKITSSAYAAGLWRICSRAVAHMQQSSVAYATDLWRICSSGLLHMHQSPAAHE